MWIELFKFIGGSSVLIAAIAWLAQSLTKHILSKDIEKYKLNLKQEADKEIERLKASLTLEAVTHQIRFSKLHEQRTDIIKELKFKRVRLDRFFFSY